MVRAVSFLLLSLGAVVVVCCRPAGYGVSETQILPLPADPRDYQPLTRFTPMQIPADNPMTPEKAALGRQLFFDTRLSGDGSRSCYSCHLNDKGLTDGRPRAVGAFNKLLSRNSPTLWNIGYQSEFYWDGRATSLEKQALAAWKGGNMGARANIDQIIALLNSIRRYRDQFISVFGEEASEDTVTKALSAYMRTIVSRSTPWDRWKAGDESAVSEAAKRGYQVFQTAKCDNCHSGIHFTSFQFYNVGIGMKDEKPDVGRFKVTKDEKNTGAFKAPTLRDVADSAPYFHNGSVATLEEAVRLMVDGGIQNEWIDTANMKKAELTEQEFADLIQFLRSLDEPTELAIPQLPR